MLHRTRETADYFDENTYAIKAMRMLDEIVRFFGFYLKYIESWGM